MAPSPFLGTVLIYDKSRLDCDISFIIPSHIRAYTFSIVRPVEVAGAKLFLFAPQCRQCHDMVSNVKYAVVTLTTVHRGQCFAISEHHVMKIVVVFGRYNISIYGHITLSVKCLNYQILGARGYNKNRTSRQGVPSAVLVCRSPLIRRGANGPQVSLQGCPCRVVLL